MSPYYHFQLFDRTYMYITALLHMYEVLLPIAKYAMTLTNSLIYLVHTQVHPISKTNVRIQLGKHITVSLLQLQVHSFPKYTFAHNSTQHVRCSAKGCWPCATFYNYDIIGIYGFWGESFHFVFSRFFCFS